MPTDSGAIIACLQHHIMHPPSCAGCSSWRQCAGGGGCHTGAGLGGHVGFAERCGQGPVERSLQGKVRSLCILVINLLIIRPCQVDIMSLRSLGARARAWEIAWLACSAAASCQDIQSLLRVLEEFKFQQGAGDTCGPSDGVCGVHTTLWLHCLAALTCASGRYAEHLQSTASNLSAA